MATPFPANEAALTSAGAFTGKIVVDGTNPFGADLNHSLNSKRPEGKRHKRSSSKPKSLRPSAFLDYENFKNVAYPEYQASDSVLKLAMLIAGDDEDAKVTVGRLCEQIRVGNS